MSGATDRLAAGERSPAVVRAQRDGGESVESNAADAHTAVPAAEEAPAENISVPRSLDLPAVNEAEGHWSEQAIGFLPKLSGAIVDGVGSALGKLLQVPTDTIAYATDSDAVRSVGEDISRIVVSPITAPGKGLSAAGDCVSQGRWATAGEHLVTGTIGVVAAPISETVTAIDVATETSARRPLSENPAVLRAAMERYGDSGIDFSKVEIIYPSGAESTYATGNTIIIGRNDGGSDDSLSSAVVRVLPEVLVHQRSPGQAAVADAFVATYNFVSSGPDAKIVAPPLDTYVREEARRNNAPLVAGLRAEDRERTLEYDKAVVTSRLEGAVAEGERLSTDNVRLTAEVRKLRDQELVPFTYTVKETDSLSLLSQTYLGSKTAYGHFHADNFDVIGRNENVIRPGQVLTLNIPRARLKELSPEALATLTEKS